jgi:hypothetical protein
MTGTRRGLRGPRLATLAPVGIAAVALCTLGLAACGGSSSPATGPASGSASAVGSAAGSASARATEPSGPVWGFARSDVAAAAIGQARALPATARGGTSGRPVTVTRLAPGRYSARFGGLGVAGGRGVATASALGGALSGTGGPGAAACRATGWAPSGADETVDVDCRSGAGTPVDSAFTTMFAFVPATTRLAGQPYAYLRDDTPTAATSTPADSYNSAQSGGVSIQRDAVGHYIISFAGDSFRPAGNNLQVNAVGDTTATCNALGRVSTGGGQQVFVGCADGTKPVDAPFALVFAARHAVVPANVAFAYAFPGVTSARGTVQLPLGPVTPAWDRFSVNTAGETNTVTHIAAGRYELSLRQVAHSPDYVAVSPYGDALHRCAVTGWQSPSAGPFGDATVTVSCVDATGAPSDSFFSLTYLSVAPGGPTTPIPAGPTA